MVIPTAPTLTGLSFVLVSLLSVLSAVFALAAVHALIVYRALFLAVYFFFVLTWSPW